MSTQRQTAWEKGRERERESRKETQGGREAGRERPGGQTRTAETERASKAPDKVRARARPKVPQSPKRTDTAVGSKFEVSTL